MKKRLAGIVIMCLLVAGCGGESDDGKIAKDNELESIQVEKQDDVIDPLHKGSDEIKVFNSLGDKKIDKSMIVQETYTYTEVKLEKMTWKISEIDGNPRYDFCFDKNSNIEEIGSEMAYAVYASFYSEESFEHVKDELIPLWVNSDVGRYTFESENDKEWVLQIEEKDSDKSIALYIDPWS